MQIKNKDIKKAEEGKNENLLYFIYNLYIEYNF